jgi:hypothetical protein
MGQAEYDAARKLRKEKAAKTIKANAKAAQAAKDKAQGKLKSAADEAFSQAKQEKRAARAASYQRSTTLPVDESTEE